MPQKFAYTQLDILKNWYIFRNHKNVYYTETKPNKWVIWLYIFL